MLPDRAYQAPGGGSRCLRQQKKLGARLNRPSPSIHTADRHGLHASGQLEPDNHACELGGFFPACDRRADDDEPSSAFHSIPDVVPLKYSVPEQGGPPRLIMAV